MKQKRFVIHCGHFLQGILSCITQIERDLAFLNIVENMFEFIETVPCFHAFGGRPASPKTIS